MWKSPFGSLARSIASVNTLPETASWPHTLSASGKLMLNTSRRCAWMSTPNVTSRPAERAPADAPPMPQQTGARTRAGAPGRAARAGRLGRRVAHGRCTAAAISGAREAVETQLARRVGQQQRRVHRRGGEQLEERSGVEGDGAVAPRRRVSSEWRSDGGQCGAAARRLGAVVSPMAAEKTVSGGPACRIRVSSPMDSRHSSPEACSSDPALGQNEHRILLVTVAYVEREEVKRMTV